MQERPRTEPGTEATEKQHQIAENPNPRANENIKHVPFEEKKDADEAVGSEITDGEAG